MEKISSSKDAAACKLLILYVLEKLNIAAGNIELTGYIIEERLMDFLSFQQRINELTATGHIASVPRDGKTLYGITDKGIALISEMRDLIPCVEKNRIDRTIYKFNRHVINERSVVADYTPEDENKSIVRLELNEGGFVALDLKIAAASKEEARFICNNWKTRAMEIYSGIVDLLLNQPDID